jgi:hypothetical protein
MECFEKVSRPSQPLQTVCFHTVLSLGNMGSFSWMFPHRFFLERFTPRNKSTSEQLYCSVITILRYLHFLQIYDTNCASRPSWLVEWIYFYFFLCVVPLHSSVHFMRLYLVLHYLFMSLVIGICYVQNIYWCKSLLVRDFTISTMVAQYCYQCDINWLGINCYFMFGDKYYSWVSCCRYAKILIL